MLSDSVNALYERAVCEKMAPAAGVQPPVGGCHMYSKYRTLQGAHQSLREKESSHLFKPPPSLNYIAILDENEAVGSCGSRKQGAQAFQRTLDIHALLQYGPHGKRSVCEFAATGRGQGQTFSKLTSALGHSVLRERLFR